MPPRSLESLWRQLVDEAGDDAVERGAAVSVARAEKDLAVAGFDVGAERARAMARIAALESPRRRQKKIDRPPTIFGSADGESGIGAGVSLQEGEKRGTPARSMVLRRGSPMTARCALREEEKQCHVDHHFVEAEPGDGLGARAGTHRRHAEAFPERAVHAREHRVHDGDARPGPSGSGRRDSPPWTRRTRASRTVLLRFARRRRRWRPLIREYTSFLRATFSSATAQLGDFGLQAPKVRQPLSTEKRAAATAKARATRAARGTTSKKQKLAVKGDVTGVIVTPVTAARSFAAARRGGGACSDRDRIERRDEVGEVAGGVLRVRARPNEPSWGRAGHPPVFLSSTNHPRSRHGAWAGRGGASFQSPGTAVGLGSLGGGRVVGPGGGGAGAFTVALGTSTGLSGGFGRCAAA